MSFPTLRLGLTLYYLFSWFSDLPAWTGATCGDCVCVCVCVYTLTYIINICGRLYILLIYVAYIYICIIYVCAVPSVVPDSLPPHGLLPTRLLCSWISQAGILEWVTISSSRGSSPPGDRPITPASPALADRSLPLSHMGSPI